MGVYREVIASLEGMRVVVSGSECRLDLYNFVENRWQSAETADWPMSRPEVQRWISGWNPVDRTTAMALLAS